MNDDEIDRIAAKVTPENIDELIDRTDTPTLRKMYKRLIWTDAKIKRETKSGGSDRSR